MQIARMRWSLVLLGLCLTTPVAGGEAVLGGDTDKLERVKVMSLGTRLQVQSDGQVASVAVETEVTPALKEAVQRTLMRWRFTPMLVDGKPTAFSVPMHLNLVASKKANGYEILVDSHHFPPEPGATAVRGDGQRAPLSAKSMSRPQYPKELGKRGMMGTVLLVVRVNADGQVGEVVAGQTQFYDNGRNVSALSLRVLENAAIRAARGWSFNVPSGERDANDMTVLVPVQFLLWGVDIRPGQWLTVWRTPKRQVAWLAPKAAENRIGIAIGGGENVSQFGAGPKLAQDVSGTPIL